VKCIDNTTNQVQLDQSAINGGRSGRLSWSRRWPPLEGLRFLLLQLLVLLLLKGQSVKHTGYGLLIRAHRLSSDAVLSTGSIATATDLCAPVIFELVQSQLRCPLQKSKGESLPRLQTQVWAAKQKTGKRPCLAQTRLLGLTSHGPTTDRHTVHSP